MHNDRVSLGPGVQRQAHFKVGIGEAAANVVTRDVFTLTGVVGQVGVGAGSRKRAVRGQEAVGGRGFIFKELTS